MSWYLAASTGEFICGGFDTQEEAEHFLWDSYPKMAYYDYDAHEWDQDKAFMIVMDKSSYETGEPIGPIFHSWDEAWDYCCEHAMLFIDKDDWSKLIIEITM